MAETPILITGAAGHLGRATLDHLLNTYHIPADQIIATTRTPETLAEYAAKGVVIRAADFDDPHSLQEAFKGAKRLLLISTNSFGTRLTQQKAAIEAAKAAGVEHVFYTSMPSPTTSKIEFAPDHAGTEEALKASGLKWTLLRNNWYFENLLMALPGAMASGTWYSAAGDGRVAYLGRDDLAKAAAAALAVPDAAGKTYTLTGGAALSTAEIASEVSRVTGKALTIQAVPVKAIQDALESHGLPGFVASNLASIDTGVAHGDLAEVTTDFATVTGSQPTEFVSWLEANKAALG